MQTPSLPVVIEAAVNGETRPDKNPNVPRKPEEIEADVIRFAFDQCRGRAPPRGDRR
jgi:hypothetical protein